MFAKAILFTCALAVKITHGDEVAALTEEAIADLGVGVTAFLNKAGVGLTKANAAVMNSDWKNHFDDMDQDKNEVVTQQEIVTYLIAHPEYIPKPEETKAEEIDA